MSLMTPKEWFELIVEPNYREFEANPTDKRRAFNAVLAAHHFWDRVFSYWRLTDETKLLGACTLAEFRKTVARQHGKEILILQDAADSLKHHFLDARRPRIVTTATGAMEGTEELLIGPTGDRVADVLARAVGYCREWTEI